MPPDPPHSAGGKAGEVYFEFVTIGRIAKVSAIDAATGTEVSISGPVSAGQKSLERTALRKLQYVMQREAEADRSAGPGKVI